jgi:hypothetical protein
MTSACTGSSRRGSSDTAPWMRRRAEAPDAAGSRSTARRGIKSSRGGCSSHPSCTASARTYRLGTDTPLSGPGPGAPSTVLSPIATKRGGIPVPSRSPTSQRAAGPCFGGKFNRGTTQNEAGAATALLAV